MVQAFTELTEDLKIRGIKPGFHLMDNEASAPLEITMTSISEQQSALLNMFRRIEFTQ